ncbi:MAG TPA: PLP-dependent aspartate aminotransferase family protein [Sediminibacterium sp.]|uniref:trans-sulfuration enzyme family protein n=1 Tax=Sediminibacterium sp. TaxID=1917865 RepID=UPI0008D6DFFB|nr:PLP-dependent aspartate aminotransferase family protein [Sediminibacterium sp.]OHC84668.1 MAG: cystathionine beta-lyase [Sphingobacteriia bacterium RIFOXYC2_FULL_35_18]OHC87585.1 MAG: cystathionine beta-lyase [Sphingobacteriia bacterium RIFOXYD2_FULL_35_12]HLD52941.1 PLP-dependent aspartate aminotransferase family protein [Sediminibacterium sp.]
MLSATKLIHSIPVDPLTGAISVPIYQTSTFVQEAPGVNKGYDYSRSNNPTRATLEELMAKLEFGATGLAFASGLAAIDAVVKLLKSGDEIVAVDDIYGGAYRLFTAVYEQYGIKVHFVDTSDLEKVAAAITPKTKLIWLETPTNPTLKISDISAIAKIAKANNCLLCVDNTFATPVLQQPLLLGADIVIHSATKYLGGHSDLIAGILVAKDEQVGARLKFFQNACGAVLAPFDSWLVIRGIETLHLRMKHHSRTALKVAQYLTTHPAVAAVYYPGLSTHPNHKLALTQSKTGGGIISFSLVNDTNEAAVDLVSNTQLFKLAESLGGIKSLISHPANMTHKSIPAEKRRAAGVSDSLIRLSIGLEEAEDLIADLASVLDSIEAKETSDAYATSNEY